MTKWKHRLTEKDLETMTAVCTECGPTPIFSVGKQPNGNPRLRCRTKHYEVRNGGYYIHKKAFCEHCGFVAVDTCQLDVDHINGRDVENSNDTSNLQTLCANCHRLKSKRPELFTGKKA